MKNITLSAEKELIDSARRVASSRNTSLNQLFREWLEGLVGQREREKKIKELNLKLSYVNAAQKFSREEMNAR